MKPVKHEDLGNDLTGRVIGAAITVHRELGPGLDEADYERALSLELLALGIEHEYEVPLPLVHKDAKLDCGYRMDLVIAGRLLLELKAIDKLHPIHEEQLLTYLRLSRINLGLLMNFNVLMLRNGIIRRANTIACRKPKQSRLGIGSDDDEVAREVVDAAVEVQNQLGTGLLRSVYEACLGHELGLRGLTVERNQSANLIYRERLILSSKQIPMIIGGKLLVTCHCVEQLDSIQLARSRSLLKAARIDDGLCINFHAPNLTGEIKRIHTLRKERLSQTDTSCVFPNSRGANHPDPNTARD